jgi:pilus assembly protein Flp/PilA
MLIPGGSLVIKSVRVPMALRVAGGLAARGGSTHLTYCMKGDSKMLQLIRNILRENKGIAALEYALIAGLMFAAIIGATAALGPKLLSAFTNLGSSLTIRDAGT